MAQHKYDMLTVPVASDAPKRHHPWYKERLKLKFMNTSKRAAALNGQRWTFVANDIDDFRAGVPTKTRGKGMVKVGSTNSFPLISKASSSIIQKSQKPEPKIMSNNPGVRTLYSKVGPRQQVQRERLEQERLAILKHPLQLYPYLEDSIPVELLDNVLEIVDPGLKTNDHSGEHLSVISDSLSCTSSQDEESEADKQSEVFLQTRTDTSPNKEQQVESSKLYKFPLKQTKEEKEREKLMAASQEVISASQQSRVDQVTHDLVQWMVDLDGAEDNQYGIDESTIKYLFSSDYESRPAQVAPVHVVELANVPPELRLESRDTSPSGYSSSPSVRYAPETQYQYGGGRMRGLIYPGKDVEEPRYVRSKYGAWYLPVDLWRVRHEDEPLQDPKWKAMETDAEDKTRDMEVDRILVDLHGAKTFKEFILTKKRGSMVPGFLEGVNMNNHFQAQKQQPLKQNH